MACLSSGRGSVPQVIDISRRTAASTHSGEDFPLMRCSRFENCRYRCITILKRILIHFHVGKVSVRYVNRLLTIVW